MDRRSLALLLADMTTLDKYVLGSVVITALGGVEGAIYIKYRDERIDTWFSYMYWAVPSASQGGITVPGMG